MSSTLQRLEKIVRSIDDIEYILHNKEIKTTQAIQDKLIKPAIRMNIVVIAEQFTKLKEANAFKVLQYGHL